MQPYSPQKFDVIAFILGLFGFMGLLSQAILPLAISIHSIFYHLSQLLWMLFLGLYNLYIGGKKLRQRKEQGEQVHWYNQPGILMGLGALLLLPAPLLEIFMSKASLNAIPILVEIAVFIPSIICLLAAGFFALRRFMGYHRRKV